MLSRCNVHAHGNSGCRPEITQTYVAMLNAGVTPVVCEKGSVGACGDLSPMSQCALSLMGEGEAFYQGKMHSHEGGPGRGGHPGAGAQGPRRARGHQREQPAHGHGRLFLYDAERWTAQAEIAAAMSLEALLANMRPYESKLHELRGFKGAVTCAANLRQIMAGSDLVTGKLKVKVQDAYSMRSTPQVIGALRDALAWVRMQVETELNGVADNPIFVPEEDKVYTGANFQGSPVSMPAGHGRHGRDHGQRPERAPPQPPPQPRAAAWASRHSSPRAPACSAATCSASTPPTCS